MLYLGMCGRCGEDADKFFSIKPRRRKGDRKAGELTDRCAVGCSRVAGWPCSCSLCCFVTDICAARGRVRSAAEEVLVEGCALSVLGLFGWARCLVAASYVCNSCFCSAANSDKDLGQVAV